MDQTTKEKLQINLAAAWKMWSNQIMVAAGAMWAAYLALPVNCTADLIASASGCNFSQHSIQDWVSKSLHVPALVFPLATAVLGVLGRVWPQKSITPAVAAAKSEAAPQPAVDSSGFPLATGPAPLPPIDPENKRP